MAKADQIVLLIEDAANRSTLRFGTWAEAHNHIRQVIMGQIVDELYELALQENPAQWKDAIDELKDLAHSINYPKDEAELRDAVAQWAEYAGEGSSYATIEIL